MLTRSVHRRSLGISILVALCHAAYGLSPGRPPSEYLRDVGLNTDPASVSLYLSNGLPAKFHAREKQYAYVNTPYERWGLYETIVDLTCELNYIDLAPCVAGLLLDPLPIGIDMDLDKYAASYGGFPETISWQRWDEVREEQLSSFRMSAAACVYRLRNVSTFPTMRKAIEQAFANYQTNPSLNSVRYIQCLGLSTASLGDTAGIEYLISLLPTLSGDQLGSCELSITYATGHRFVQRPTLDTRSARERADQWRNWWQSEKGRFDFSNVPATLEAWSKEPLPAPNSMTERLHIASSAQNRQYREVQAWFDTNGKSSANEIKTIAEDEKVDRWTRGLASAAYVKYGGPSARRWLHKLATERFEPGTNPYDHQDLPCDPFQLLASLDKDDALRSAVRCIKRRGLRAELAAQYLSGFSDQVPFLAKTFPSFQGRFAVQSFLVQQLIASGFASKTPYEAAVSSEYRFVAVCGYYAILHFNLAAQLDDDTRARLAVWEQNPLFLIDLARTSQSDPKLKDLPWLAEVERASKLASGLDAASTVAHSRIAAYYFAAGPGFEARAEDEYSRFTAGVNAYRAARGRPIAGEAA